MNRLILASYTDTNTNKRYKELYINDYQFKSAFDTFNNLNFENVDILPLVVRGKTYHEKQDSARQLAQAFQDFLFRECDIDLSILEIAEIVEYFEKIGKTYRLLKEFRENAIC